MKRLFPTVLIALALPVNAYAVICKTVDADGVVSYSDVPVAECPQAVKLPDYSRYSPRPVTPPGTSDAGEAEETADTAAFSGYTGMSFIEPQMNATVRSNEGRVPVTIELEPSLQPGHQISLFLDARAVPGEFSGTRMELSGVERGTHSLRAQVKNAIGEILMDSPSVLFTLRKTGLFDNANRPENPVEPPPGFPNPGNPNPDFPNPGNPNPGFGSPGDPPDYNPGTPDYTPGGGGIPATPGGNNPAFAPKYTP